MTLEQKYNEIVSDIISRKITQEEGVAQLIAIGMTEVRAIATAHLAISGSDIICRPNSTED